MLCLLFKKAFKSSSQPLLLLGYAHVYTCSVENPRKSDGFEKKALVCPYILLRVNKTRPKGEIKVSQSESSSVLLVTKPHLKIMKMRGQPYMVYFIFLGIILISTKHLYLAINLNCTYNIHNGLTYIVCVICAKYKWSIQSDKVYISLR